MGLGGCIPNGNGGKLKGMPLRTIERIYASHDSHVNRALAGMAEQLGLLRGGWASLICEAAQDHQGPESVDSGAAGLARRAGTTPLVS